MTGKVWLVGAGPGDVGLFYLKGKQVLEQAEVVVYDSLVGDGRVGDGSRRRPAYQRRKTGRSSSDETGNDQSGTSGGGAERISSGAAEKGDPFLFGRGGEELELLSEHGIPYEVVPA